MITHVKDGYRLTIDPHWDRRGKIIMQRHLCVFAGSNMGTRKAFADAARALGRELVTRNYALVYGGAAVGLMGVLADAVLEEGGDAIGVIPRALAEKEIAHKTLSQLHIVDSMHERKAMMADLADAFVAIPGGFGTVEEFFEVLTWAQLGMHEKPCGLIDVDGFFGPLTTFLDRCVDDGFVKHVHRGMVPISNDPQELLNLLEDYRPIRVDKWITREML